MADVTWSAYALAMFTPEQRAAAMNVGGDQLTEGGTGGRPITVGSSLNPVYSGLPQIVTGPGIPASGLNPNNPSEAAQLYALGWTFQQGAWRAPASPGVAQTPTQVLASSGGRAPGLSAVQSVSGIGGGSVLGSTVPAAPAVMLPSWVGGRIGHVVRSGGTRPESGGQPRIIKGEGHKYPWTNVVK